MAGLKNNAASVSDFVSLRFPSDLGTNEVPHYIRFEPLQCDYGSIKGANAVGAPSAGSPTSTTSKSSASSKSKAKSGGLLSGLVDSVKNKVENKLTSSISKAAGSSSVGRALGSFISGKLTIGNFDVEFGGEVQPDVVLSKGSINLYLPESLSSQTSADYEGVETGATGKILQDMGSGDSAADMSNSAGAGAVSQLMGELSKNVGSIRATTAMKAGVVSNNYSFQIFGGVPHRNFSYSFNLVPRDEREADEIKKICETFQYYMLPSRQDAESPDSLSFFEIPAMWKVEYLGQEGPLEYIQGPQGYMFLTSCSVEYGGESGGALYTNGAPMQSTLNLEFVEIEPLYRT